jgi:hypothetical protein
MTTDAKKLLHEPLPVTLPRSGNDKVARALSITPDPPKSSSSHSVPCKSDIGAPCVWAHAVDTTNANARPDRQRGNNRTTIFAAFASCASDTPAAASSLPIHTTHSLHVRLEPHRQPRHGTRVLNRSFRRAYLLSSIHLMHSSHAFIPCIHPMALTWQCDGKRYRPCKPYMI